LPSQLLSQERLEEVALNMPGSLHGPHHEHENMAAR
jgi:hypothetical protein